MPDLDEAADDADPDGLVDPTDVVGRRVAGWLVDTALIAATALIVVVVLGDSFERPGSDIGLELRQIDSDTAVFFRSTVAVVHAWEWLVAAAVAAVAALLLLVVLPGRRGWTPGLLAADLRLVDQRGEHTGIRRALVRFVGWLIDLLPGVPLVGFGAMRLGRHHQRVGDHMARTYVVDRAFAGRPPTEPAPPETGGLPAALVTDEEVDHGGGAADKARVHRLWRRRRRAEPATEEPPPEPGASGPVAPETAAGEAGAWAPAAAGADRPDPGEAESRSGSRRDRGPATEPESPADAGTGTAHAGSGREPPEGIVADQPLWDRRRERYVMWHGRSGRWLAYDDTEQSWKPLRGTAGGDPPR